MTKDQDRLAWISEIMDGVGDSDFKEIANKIHQDRCGCGRGPVREDYYRAVAQAIDAYRSSPTVNCSPENVK